MKGPQGTEKENPLLHEVLADDAGEGHHKRLSRYAAAKARQLAVVDFIIQQEDYSGKSLFPKEKKALETCGSFLVFRHYYALDKYRLLAGCTCKKHLLCALCAIRRAAKCVAVYSEKIAHVTESDEYDTFMITMTVKNGQDLEERYDHLTRSFNRLLHKRRNALASKPTQDTVFKHVDGAILSYEVTISEHGYHPHIHCIALVKKGVFTIEERKIKGKAVKVAPELHAGLVQDWKEITGDSFIVDVRLIDNEEDKMSALVECFKYALKFSEMDVADQVHCYSILKARRMISSFGALFGVKLPDNLNDDLLPGEEKFIDIVYQYSGSTFGYQVLSEGETSIQVSSLSSRFKRKGRKSLADSVSRFGSQVEEWIRKGRAEQASS